MAHDPELEAAMSHYIETVGGVIEAVLGKDSPAMMRAGVLGPVVTRVFRDLPEASRMDVFERWVALTRKNITPGEADRDQSS